MAVSSVGQITTACLMHGGDDRAFTGRIVNEQEHHNRPAPRSSIAPMPYTPSTFSIEGLDSAAWTWMDYTYSE
jgi:hypothetical protein